MKRLLAFLLYALPLVGMGQPITLRDSVGNLQYKTASSTFRNVAAGEVARRNVFDMGVTADAMTMSQLVSNAAAFQTALRSGTPLSFHRSINLYGLLTATNVPIDLRGIGLNVQIRQQGPFGVFDIGTGSESVSMENINLYPGVNVTGSYAIKITGAGGNNSNVKLNNVIINRGETVGGVTRLFEGGGYWLVNLGEGQINNCKYFGTDHTRGTAMNLTNTVIAVSSTINNFKVYGAKTGLKVVSTGNPGQEGLRVLHSDFVTCGVGIDARSDGTYGVYYPPQIQIIDDHFNCFEAAVKMRRFTQVNMSDNLVYLFNDTSRGSVGFDLDSVNEATVADNKFYKVGVGAVNGVVIGSFTSDIKAHDNFARMQTGDGLIVINAGSVRTRAIGNDAINMSASVADFSNAAEYWGNFLNGVLQPSSLVRRFTSAVVGSGNITLPAAGTAGSEIYTNLPDTFTGINPGDAVDFSRVGGQGSFPPEIKVSFECIEANKIRINIRNTATTSKIYLASQYDLKVTRH